MLCHFVYEDVKGDGVKSLIKVKVNSISCSCITSTKPVKLYISLAKRYLLEGNPESQWSSAGP